MVSKEAPRITTFFLPNSDDRSRNPQPSRVQPGVSAFGKNQRTTVFPLKSPRETSRPSWSFTLKSGAWDPTGSIARLLVCVVSAGRVSVPSGSRAPQARIARTRSSWPAPLKTIEHSPVHLERLIPQPFGGEALRHILAPASAHVAR